MKSQKIKIFSMASGNVFMVYRVSKHKKLHLQFGIPAP